MTALVYLMNWQLLVNSVFDPLPGMNYLNVENQHVSVFLTYVYDKKIKDIQ